MLIIGEFGHEHLTLIEVDESGCDINALGRLVFLDVHSQHSAVDVAALCAFLERLFSCGNFHGLTGSNNSR